MPPVLVFALRVDLVIFVLPYEFYGFFPISVKNVIGVLT